MSEDNDNLLFGGWVVAIGTVISALANTPSFSITPSAKNDLKIIGNSLQATGNAIQVERLTSVQLENIANEIQAIGNTTVISSLILPFDKQIKNTLNTKGNLLQALGGGISFSEDWNKERTINVLYSGIGNLLQVIGNSMQALSTQSKKSEMEWNTIGNWIQATGALMTAIAVTI
ncbi:DUF6944 family repetitive protein [Gracilibacillus massiliensis]|uniref:DUF6944 family repetitive protein n=1 Tax=Gracilibacillus massiliensis TaxID=1564956 RepID=UPI00071D5933|nr:hypothetical protein [Gracilibacillus massiliensis]